jgi:hypothetical protein
MKVEEQLRQAIEQLFLPSASPASLQGANAFLFRISESKDCFFAALHLIVAEKDFRVAHFAANMLYNKVALYECTLMYCLT